MTKPLLKDAPARARRGAAATDESARARVGLPADPPPPPVVTARDLRRARLRREIGGIGLILLAVFMAGALLFEQSAAGVCLATPGIFGPVGACLRGMLVGAVGAPAAALLPLLPLVHGLRLLGRIAERPDRSWLVCLAGALLLLPVAVGLARGAPIAVDVWAGLWGNLASL